MKAELFLGSNGISDIPLGHGAGNLTDLLKKYAEIQCIAFGEYLCLAPDDLSTEDVYKKFIQREYKPYKKP